MTNYFFLNLFSSLLLCVYLLVIKTRSLWWWQWMGKQGGEEEGRMTSTSRFTSRLARRTLGTMWGRQRPSISITLSSLSAIRDTWEQEGHYILFFLNLLLFFFFFFLNLYMKCVLLTSAPRRLSEHILQKDNKACWKAGDNFLRHHKKQKTKNSHYSLQHLICTPQVLWRMSWPLNDWGLE